MNSEHEIDFLRTYKDFIYFFNMLECNIGYSLRYCTERTKNKNPGKWLDASFDSKIKKVVKLVNAHKLETVFHDWLSDVEKCRHLRNIVAHGHWEWRENLERPILYHALDIPKGQGSFTVEEFQLKLRFLQDVGTSFNKIRAQLEAACHR